MSTELEFGALASLSDASPIRHQKADLKGQPCQNCGSDVTDRYCGNCGQFAASFHRPIWTLIGEALTDTFALDGRMLRTIPLLFFRPGRLTRKYITGQRARFMPPFRLFLLTSLLFFFAFFSFQLSQDWVVDNLNVGVDIETTLNEVDVDAEEKEEILKAVEAYQTSETQEAQFLHNLEARARNVLEKPEYFLELLQKWTPRFSLLVVPISIFTLLFLHIFNRKAYVFDHVIHALHLHSWFYLFSLLIMALGGLLNGWAITVFITVTFAYVWRSLAIVYDAGKWISLGRTLLLMLIWFISLVLLLAGTVTVSALGL